MYVMQPRVIASGNIFYVKTDIEYQGQLEGCKKGTKITMTDSSLSGSAKNTGKCTFAVTEVKCIRDLAEALFNHLLWPLLKSLHIVLLL